MKHTPTPWIQHNERDIFTEFGATNAHGIAADDNNGWFIASTSGGKTFVYGLLESMKYKEEVANARRIVACVNACEGIETSALESGGTIVADLLEQLERTVEFIKNYGNHKCLQSIKFCVHCLLLSEASAAIAKAKGEEQAPATEPQETTEYREFSAGWWFNKMPEPIRSQAIANINEVESDRIFRSLSFAIMDSFYWEDAKQGGDYWSEIYTRAIKGEFDNKSNH